MTYHTQTLLDRKDRMSISTGLEVRVSYCNVGFSEVFWQDILYLNYIHPNLFHFGQSAKNMIKLCVKVKRNKFLK